MDVGRLYVDLKLLVNCFVSSSSFQLFLFLMCSTMTLLRRRGVTTNFALLFPWFLPVFLLLADNSRGMIVAPEIHHIFADHG
jgi:hypothetical protein